MKKLIRIILLFVLAAGLSVGCSPETPVKPDPSQDVGPSQDPSGNPGPSTDPSTDPTTDPSTDPSQEPEDVAVTGVSLNKHELTLPEGGSETLVATVLPENATDKTVSWRSSSDRIVSVDGSGKVTAVAEGTAKITVSAGSFSDECEVTVVKNVIEVTQVNLDRTTLTMTEGDEVVLTATVLPEDATDKTVTWLTENSGVATVQDGKVKAVGEGRTTITAMAGNVSATCAVTVNKKYVEVSGVSLNKSELVLKPGSSETLVATVLPEDATDKSVEWSSSEETVVTVSQNGLVTAVNVGEATVKVVASGFEASCKVTVREDVVTVTNIRLDKTSLQMTEGDTETLTATVLPENATDKTVTWISSDPSVASVSNGLVTALKAGTATITASAGNVKATCSVTVKAKVVEVTSVTLNKTTLTLVEGSSETLVATVLPDNATNKAVSWTSDAVGIATVDASGKVTAKAVGQATITATADGKKATCVVTVVQNIIAVTSVTLNKTSLSLEAGSEETLIATVGPSNATDKTVTWKSSDPTIASVDAGGRVKAIKEGKATITAMAGNEKATCEVTVTPKPGGGEGGDTEDVSFEKW